MLLYLIYTLLISVNTKNTYSWRRGCSVRKSAVFSDDGRELGPVAKDDHGGTYNCVGKQRSDGHKLNEFFQIKKQCN